MMRFSLVIPTHNRREVLRRCLEAATRQDYTDYGVIVVDDASTDGTADMVQREWPQVRLIRQVPNRGPAAARNRGIAAAAGEIVAFTDDDCVVPPDFLSRLAEGFRRYPQVAGVGGYMEAPDELLVRNPYARYESYLTHHVYRAGSQPYVGGMECPAGGTNSMAYRRETLLAVGGFDEGFQGAGAEDADIKQRIVEAGNLLLYLPIKVVHLRPYTLTSFWRQFRAHGRGTCHFQRKYGGASSFWPMYPLRALARLARCGVSVVRIGPQMAAVQLVAGWADLVGQWQEARQCR
jgi:GT2 family glycosyltransferase